MPSDSKPPKLTPEECKKVLSSIEVDISTLRASFNGGKGMSADQYRSLTHKYREQQTQILKILAFSEVPEPAMSRWQKLVEDKDD